MSLLAMEVMYFMLWKQVANTECGLFLCFLSLEDDQVERERAGPTVF